MTQADSVHSTPPTNTSAPGSPPQEGAQTIPAGLATQEANRQKALKELRRLRKEASEQVEQLLAMLDALDGYTLSELEEAADDIPCDDVELDGDREDDENGHDDEPFLGAPEIPPSFDEWSDKYQMWFTRQGDQTRWASGSCDGREDEPEHDEDTNDAEPTLGSLSSSGGNQAVWGSRSDGDIDAEDEHDGCEPDDGDAEPSLGWTEPGVLGGCPDGMDREFDPAEMTAL